MKLKLETEKLPIDLELRHANSVAVRASGLPRFGDTDFNEWYWRSLNGLTDKLNTLAGKNGWVPNFASFRPEYLSRGRHSDFAWIEYFFKEKGGVFRVGNITECDFSIVNDPSRGILVPIGWSRMVVDLVKSGALGFIAPMRLLMTSGECGLYTPAPQSLH